MPAGQAALEVRGVEKTFRIPKQQISTLKERVLHPLRAVEHEELDVLKGVSFSVARGEFFGIVGRNGSGKSTLLKCVAGIYRADAGTIHVDGRLSPFIELGVGFNPDLTARENVIINAVMMGITTREARRRFDAVLAFAELEEFVDLKLKNYSSGMQVRLAFSVMVQTDADVMLIDEVLAVGDAAFQQKCLDVFYDLRARGKTIVLVTHDMGTVERFCHRAMLLRDGHIDVVGDPHAVGQAYLELNFERGAHVAGGADAPGARVLGVWAQAEDGSRLEAVPHGARVRLHAIVEALEPIDRPRLAVWLDSPEDVRVFAASTRDREETAEPLAPGERLELCVEFENALSSGHYMLGCGLTRGPDGAEPIVEAPRATDFVVYGGQEDDGLVSLPHTIEVNRGLERVPS